jgi:hypothetical protein
LELGLEGIAAPVPLAVAAARAIAKIKVAVCAALIARLAADSGQERRSFGVVARSEALGILVVDEAIVIVVHAVATERDASIAENELAPAIRATGPSARASTTRACGAAATHATGTHAAAHATGTHTAAHATGTDIAAHATGTDIAARATAANIAARATAADIAARATAANAVATRWVTAAGGDNDEKKQNQ